MPPLVVIVGETASGKSALSMELAEKFGGEIICADSRTVYKGLDIGTAKPTVEERATVPHHLLDVVKANEHFSAAQFKELALAAIANISARGKLPILVGGTGLYIDSVLYDYEFRPTADSAERERLQTMSVMELQAEITQKGFELPTNFQNKRHLTRLLETSGASSVRHGVRKNTLLIGLRIDKEELKKRIVERVDAMITAGFIDEVQRLSNQYGFDVPGLLAPGYKAYRKYLEARCTLTEAREEFIKNDLHLAKRQRTWFKRNSRIQWLNDRSNAVEIVTTFLNK